MPPTSCRTAPIEYARIVGRSYLTRTEADMLEQSSNIYDLDMAQFMGDRL